MANQLTSNAAALPLFFDDEIFLINPAANTQTAPAIAVNEEVLPVALPQIKPTAVVEATILTPPEFKFKGQNKKNILILVNDPLHEVSTPEGVELLRKLVLAIQLQGADFALLNYAHYPNTSFQTLKDFFNCKLLLAFGVAATELQLNEPTLHQLTNQEDTQMVLTTNLQTLPTNTAAKAMLWASLKQLSL